MHREPEHTESSGVQREESFLSEMVRRAVWKRKAVLSWALDNWQHSHGWLVLPEERLQGQRCLENTDT